MDSIDVRRPHGLTPRQARAVAQAIAEELSERYGAGYRWEGDTLRFSRFGLRGRLDLLPGEVRVQAELGMMFLASRDRLRDRIVFFLENPPKTNDAKTVRAAVRSLLSVTSADRPPPKPPRKPRAKPADPVAPPAQSQSAPAGALPATARRRRERDEDPAS